MYNNLWIKIFVCAIFDLPVYAIKHYLIVKFFNLALAHFKVIIFQGNPYEALHHNLCCFMFQHVLKFIWIKLNTLQIH